MVNGGVANACYRCSEGMACVGAGHRDWRVWSDPCVKMRNACGLNESIESDNESCFQVFCVSVCVLASEAD